MFYLSELQLVREYQVKMCSEGVFTVHVISSASMDIFQENTSKNFRNDEINHFKILKWWN